MTETWKVIPGFSRYSASDLGRVRRDVAIYRTPAGICKQHLKQGYPSVCATDDDGKSHTLHVHALVMRAFVGPLPKGMHVCHADGDRGNAERSNLRYDTPTANVHDAIVHGTQVRGVNVSQALLSEAQVRGIVGALDRGCTYESLAAIYEVTKHCIYRIAAGQTWKHVTGGKDRRNGYKFAHIGLRAARAKRLKAAGLADLAKLDDGAVRTLDGFRVWRAL